MNLVLLKSMYNSLSRQEKLIANFVFKNPGLVSSLSVSDLSKKAKVGSATITRYCRKAGVSGFQEFKIELAKEIARKEETVFTKAIEEDNQSHLFTDITSENISALADSMKIVDKDRLEEIATRILKARNTTFYGIGASYAVALIAKFKFAKIGISANAENDIYFQTISTMLLKKSDVAVFFCFNDEAYDFDKIIHNVRRIGSSLVIISNYEIKDKDADDIVILSATSPTLFQDNEITSSIVQLNILDMLYTCVSCKLGDKAQKRLKEVMNLRLNR